MARFERAADVRTGVVGYGAAFDMGRRHLSDMRKAGMTPCAVAEMDPERLAAAGRDFPGIELYRSVGEMLRKSAVNLVVLITPHNTHARLALKCLRAGRHVITEKPFAITTAQCDAMIREAEARDLMLSAYHNRHWDGCVLEALKHLHEEKAIGEIYRVDARIGGYGRPGDWWRSSRSISGGIMYDWGVHFLEYALQIIPENIVEVAGFSKTGFWAGPDPVEGRYERGRGLRGGQVRQRRLAEPHGIVARVESQAGATGDLGNRGQLRLRRAHVRDDTTTGR